MNFAEMGTIFKVKEDYTIELPEGDYLAITVPVEYGTSAAKFDHVNIKATQRQVLEFKHYRRGGSKFWTSKPGMSYLFIVPKEKIEFNEEKSGHSYVYVTIRGQEYCLSCSGGTSGNGWTDWISQGCSTFVHKTAKKLHAIADAADYDGLVELGSARIPDEYEQRHYRRLCAYHDTRSKLKEGDKIFLEGCWYEDSQGPFTILNRPSRKRYFRCDTGSYNHSYVKIKYSQIDWIKTAEANDVALV